MKKSKGHSEHTQSADSPESLPGRFGRRIKITMLGAGSGFTPRVLNDILLTDGNQGGVISLVDIDRSRLATMKTLIEMLVAKRGGQWDVQASTDRRAVMAGSDYIVNCVEVSGVECVKFDNDIPAKYGVDQCIGDTIGPGGLFKGLRTVPVWLGILRDAEELCPDVIILNYTNPMSMLCLAAGRTSPVQFVGLCHSVQGTSHLLAQRAGVPYEELDWECAGINHLAWFTKLRRGGRNLYPKLNRLAERDLQDKPPADADEKDLVRKAMMLHFGAFITESSGHLSEYLPWFRKRKALLKKYARPGYDGESGFYVKGWPTWRTKADRERLDLVAGRKPLDWTRSWEYASWIIEAREKNVPFRFHGNVMNTLDGGGSLITNLMSDGCVEVACLVDGNGIQPTRFGALPRQMAAVCESNMRFFDLAAEAAIHRSIESSIHALSLDPLTSAVCGLTEIRDMTLELFRAEKRFLPGYR
jgi:alpha-galactosidase